jgi:hypothetical protein
MMDAIALASLWLSDRNEAMLPGEVLCDAVCRAPIIPPELAEAAIADCASFSQLEPVLEAIDGVEAIVDSSELPTVLSVELLEAVAPVEPEDEYGFGSGKPAAIDDTDIVCDR